jgi:uncharacterized membrane protein YraQ (UPF0718 family)
MDFKSQWKSLTAIVTVFLIFYFVPFQSGRVRESILEGIYLTSWYAREHVILCLIPAFFIAGAIAVFIRKDSVLRYLGAGANKILSYGVASVSGSILAVCSCTVLPIFAGVYKMGAGIGPATAFLYAGPAINVLAIILTMRILGLQLGIARAVGAVIFSIVIGLSMHLFFGNDEDEKRRTGLAVTPQSDDDRPLVKNVLYFAVMIGILIFANWGKPGQSSGIWNFFYVYKWYITGAFGAILAVILVAWLNLRLWQVLSTAAVTIILSLLFPQWPLLPFSAAVLGLSIILARRTDEPGEWFAETWGFTKQIMPLLFAGVLVAGLLLGRPGHEGLIPSHWISGSVGGNSLGSNLFASIVGAFMYFATLTEVPILQGLIGNGMGKGPALALLLAGPALSLPNMLVIASVMGVKKTIVFILLVIMMATLTGLIYGSF